MKVAILGLGTVGYGVYDILIKKVPTVEIKYILDKDKDLKSKYNLDTNVIITNSFDEILKSDVETIIECMGAHEFSYKCIKESLENKKNVITANKEVIAEHLKELTKLKIEKGVSLYYEACVGGGVPIIKNLYNIIKVNNVKSIIGILNGTTNYILSKMTNENLTFSDALRLAQENGFAESDPTNDLEGYDMIRKIVILSSIAYKTNIDVNKIWCYGIKSVSDIDIKYAMEKGFKIKLLATSYDVDNNIDIKIEPVFVKDIISLIDGANNIISVNADINDTLLFVGKGAGRYPTANAMVNDLLMIMDNEKNYTFAYGNKRTFKESKIKNKYYLRVKDVNLIDKEIIDEIKDNLIITKEITFNKIKEIIKNIYFYARIGE